MSKYLLNPKHINDTIITKCNGNDTVVTSATFNDYFAECMLQSGQSHLVIVNREFVEDVSQKKSFVQISEDVISLTSKPDEIGKNEPNKIASEPGSKQSAGKQSQKKESNKQKDLNQPK